MIYDEQTIDLERAGARRDQRLAQLAGRLTRAAVAGAADAPDGCLALAVALIAATRAVGCSPVNELAAASNLLDRLPGGDGHPSPTFTNGDDL